MAWNPGSMAARSDLSATAHRHGGEEPRAGYLEALSIQQIVNIEASLRAAILDQSLSRANNPMGLMMSTTTITTWISASVARPSLAPPGAGAGLNSMRSDSSQRRAPSPNAGRGYWSNS